MQKGGLYKCKTRDHTGGISGVLCTCAHDRKRGVFVMDLLSGSSLMIEMKEGE